MPITLSELLELAFRFVPVKAADYRVYRSGPHSWWPAHEMGHFLVASPRECRMPLFGLEYAPSQGKRRLDYITAKELAATSISQRLLRQSGYFVLANDEIEYTSEDTLEWGLDAEGKRLVSKYLKTYRARRLPTTFKGLEALLKRKAKAVGTPFYASRAMAEGPLQKAVSKFHNCGITWENRNTFKYF